MYHKLNDRMQNKEIDVFRPKLKQDMDWYNKVLLSFCGLFILFIGSFKSMAMDIVTVEQPEYKQILKTKAQEVLFPLSKKDHDLIVAMKQKLYELGGVGLAAPQVNASRKIIAIYIPEEATLLRDNVTQFYSMHIMINPSYEAVNAAAVCYDFESCYSVSSKSGKVPRYEQIKVSYYDEAGQFHQKIEQGFYARVLQHEIDHVNGLLILDRLTPDCIQGTFAEMMALRRASLSAEKRLIFDQVVAKKAKR